jgi:hypothetical protein
MFDEKHLKICGCTVVWDAITSPDTNDSGKQKWGLKVVVAPGNPDLALAQQLANGALQTSKWKGVLPNGGNMPLGTATAAEFNGMFNGYAVFSAGTYRGIPEVFDENGGPIDPMQLSNLLYPGQQVDVLVHTYEYDNKSKGIAFGLSGFAIIASANAPRQNFGGASVNAAAAFGGGSAAPAQQPQQAAGPGPGPAAAPAQQPQQAANFLQPQKYQTADGQWTREQLAGAGFTDAQIDALPKV